MRAKFAVRLTPEVGTGWSGMRSPARNGPALLKTSEGWSAPKVAQALDVAESKAYSASSGVSPRRRAGRGAPGPAPSQPVRTGTIQDKAPKGRWVSEVELRFVTESVLRRAQ